MIVFAGLPASGKTTIARALASHLRAVHLRIDTIEQALIKSGIERHQIGPMGYIVAYDLARDNLRLGNIVIADSVNPISITRQAWRAVTSDESVPILEVEIVCSDPAIHRQRAEARARENLDEYCPTWSEIESREYHSWDFEPMRIDSFSVQVEQAVELIVSALKMG